MIPWRFRASSFGKCWNLLYDFSFPSQTVNILCPCQNEWVLEGKYGFWDSIGMQGICGGQGGAVREPSAPHAPRSSPQGKKMFVRQWLSSQVLEILFPPHPLQMKWLVVSRWLPCKWQDFRELMSKTWWSSNISPHQRASQYCWKFSKQPWEWCLPMNKWPLDNGFVKLTKAARAPEVVPPAWLKTVFILFKSSKGQFYKFHSHKTLHGFSGHPKLVVYSAKQSCKSPFYFPPLSWLFIPL